MIVQYLPDSNSYVELFITALVTLLAAYLGAWFAFTMQRSKQQKDQDDSNIVNANLAMFELIRCHNQFLNIKAQVIGENENRPDRHHFIKPMLNTPLHVPQINFPSLAFLINKDPNLLCTLAVLQTDIHGTVEIIRQRSEIHIEKLQPLIEQFERSRPGESAVDLNEIENAFGRRNTAHLVLSTNYMIDGINRAIESTADLSTKLRKAVKLVYPKSTIIRLDE
jgi:hypothetical protein